MKCILVIDEKPECLSEAEELLEDKYYVITTDTMDCLEKYLNENVIDLIFISCEIIKKQNELFQKKRQEWNKISTIPVIGILKEYDAELESECLDNGVSDVIVNPFQRTSTLKRIQHIFAADEERRLLRAEGVKKSKQLETMTLQAITAIANTIDSKDKWTRGHSVRVAKYATEIARRMKWTEEEITTLNYIALLHDVGNVGIPESILNKQGKLSEEEYRTLKRHTTIGEDILQGINSVKEAALCARCHHEWYDGNGYLDGRKGEEIPIEARIIAVAEAYDAMTTDRSYRKRLSTEEVLQELEKGRGTQFDPDVTDIMIEMVKEGFECSEEDPVYFKDDTLVGESSALIHRILSGYTEEIKNAAHRDSLTGVWNRSYAEEKINEFLSERRNNGVLFMMDMDDFKSINDTYGHIIGDEMLIKFAETLQKLTRQDDIVCRLGGDEFMVFLKGACSHSAISEKAEQILVTLENCLIKPDSEESVSVSIGIAKAPFDGTDFATLYSKADKSLYFVKQNGKNSYHFFSEEQSVERNALKHKGTQVDLNHLKGFIQEMGYKKGAYQVEYDGFKKIYRFVSRCIARTGQDVQIVLFTLTDYEGNLPKLEYLINAMDYLRRAVVESIRRGDVATDYSSSQLVVILMDSSEEDGKMVADRVVNKYHAYGPFENVQLTYDLQTVTSGPVSNDW